MIAGIVKDAQLSELQARLEKWISWHAEDVDRLLKIQDEDRESKSLLLANWESAYHERDELAAILRTERENYAEDRKEWEIQLAAMKDDKAYWQQSSESWYQSFKQEQAQRSQALGERDDLQSELGSAQSALGYLSDERDALAAQLADMTAARDYWANACLEAETSTRDAVAAQYNLRAERDDLAAKLADLENTVEVLSGMNADQAATIDNLNLKLTERSILLSQARYERDQARAVLAQVATLASQAVS